MDFAQITLIAVIILLTVLLIALGIQVFFILRELRKTVSKANRVLDHTESITQSVSAPLSSLSSISTGIKTGATFINLIKKIILPEKSSIRKNKGEDNG